MSYSYFYTHMYAVRSLMKLNAAVALQLPAGKLIVVFFYGAVLHSYRNNSMALGGESCSSSRKPVSDSCVQLYQ
jgi:hypothetical protein